MRVLVTGGSGIVGYYVIDELIKAGHSVVNADLQQQGNLSHSGNVGLNASSGLALSIYRGWENKPTFFKVDIKDYGQVVSAMQGVDAVISLASRPTPFGYVEEDVFVTNVSAVWNVCRAVEQLKIKRLVLASSYNALGAFATASSRNWAKKRIENPDYFPLDENSSTCAEDPYSVSKWVGEHVADAFVRRNKDLSIASLRLTGVWDEIKLKSLSNNPVQDPWDRAQGFWSYVSIRDTAKAFLLAVSCPPWEGHKRMFVNAKDTMLDIPTTKALNTVYPKVKLAKEFSGYESIVSTLNTTEITGWEPNVSWRDF